MLRFFSIIISSFVLLGAVQAQSSGLDSLMGLGLCDENGFCNPNLPGLPRSKGFELIEHRGLDYGIRTKIQDSLGSSNSEVDSENRISLKLKFPILLKDKIQMGMGLSYTKQSFNFDNPENLENEFYQNLEDKPLRRVSSSLYAIRPFKGNKYLAGRLNFSLNGDFNSGIGQTQDYVRSSVAVLYGVRSRLFKVEGFGLAYSYNFGRAAIYPLYALNQQFNNKMGIELLLPLYAKLRYGPNDKNFFFLSTELDGSNYNINLDSSPDQSLYLGKSDLLGMLTYEKEIYDFFWASASVGYRVNLNFDLDREIEFVNRSDAYIDNTINNAMFVRIGVFLVPPRSWMEKFGK